MTFGRRLLLGASVLGVIPVAVGGLATQHVAAAYGYPDALGGTVVGRLYPPWKFITWWFAYQPNPPSVIDQAFWIALAAYGGLTLMLSAVLVLGGRRSRPHKDLHGTAHWASADEIRASGLLPRPAKKAAKRPPGIIVGARRKGQRLDYLTHVGPEHVLLVAPSRSGKGVSVIVPTLLTWSASMVVHDLKGELHALSAGWRAQHANNRIIRFDPAAPADKTHKFNPLSELRIGANYEVADAQNAATIIVDPDGKGLHDHWTKTAHALLTGVLLYCMYKSRDAGDPTRHTANLYDVAYALSDPSRPVAELYDDMIQNAFGIGGGQHPVIAAAGRDMLNRPDAERGSVLSTTMSYLTLYRDPMVKANTSCSDFSVSDLMHGERPMTLYLVIRPADKDRLRPLMRLMITLILRRLTSRELVVEHGQPKQDYQHRLLLLLDEFASLGKLDIIRENLAYIAGWGINALISMQNRQQFLESFGRDDSTTAQCKVAWLFRPCGPRPLHQSCRRRPHPDRQLPERPCSPLGRGARFARGVVGLQHRLRDRRRGQWLRPTGHRVRGKRTRPSKGRYLGLPSRTAMTTSFPKEFFVPDRGPLTPRLRNFSPTIATLDEPSLAPGVIANLSPDEAESFGPFEETALSFEDAWESCLDADPSK